jgi:hypothetical protein
MPTQEDLVAIEHQLWRGDARDYEARLHDDAVLVFTETGAIDKQATVRSLEADPSAGSRWADVDLQDPRFTPIGREAVLLTYRAVARRASESLPRVVLASSLYVRDGHDWRLAFHQQSPATAASADSAVPAVSGPRAVRAAAVGATALGALAIGALAVGALAVGRVAVGAMTLGRGRVRRLTIEQLEVHRIAIG